MRTANRVAIAFGGASLAAAGCDVLVGLEPPRLVVVDASVGTPSGPADGAAADHDRDGSVDAAEGTTGEASVEAAGEAGDAGPDAPLCNASACPSGCDLASDGANCGACAHSCLGGACEKGRCLPTVLANGSPVSLATEGTSVYWIEATYGEVLSCPAGGCPDGGTTVFLGTGSGSPGTLQVGGLAVRSGEVFFMEASSGYAPQIHDCPVTGCDSQSVAFTTSSEPSGFLVPGSLATDESNLYWTSAAGLEECPIAGCNGPAQQFPIYLMGPYPPTPGGVIAAGSGWVFFTDFTYGIAGCIPSTGCNCGPTGCGSGIGTMGSAPARDIAVGASAVYWTNGGMGGLFAHPLGDAGASTLFARGGGPGAVAVDADDVYFGSTDDGGTLYRCAVGGCGNTPTSVASGLGNISSLAVDATRIYAVVGATVNQGSPALPFGTPLTGNAIIAIAK